MANPSILTIGSFIPNKICGKIPFGRKLDLNIDLVRNALRESTYVLIINVVGKSFTAREKTTRLLVDCFSKKSGKAAVYIDPQEPNVEDAILMWKPYILEIGKRKVSVAITTLPYTDDEACYKVALETFNSIGSIQVLCADVDDDDPKFMLTCLDAAGRMENKWFFIQTDAATDDCTRLRTLNKFVDLLRNPDSQEKLMACFEKLDSKMMKIRNVASDDDSNEELMKFIEDKLQSMYPFAFPCFKLLRETLLIRLEVEKDIIEKSSKQKRRWKTFEAVSSRLPHCAMFVLAAAYLYRCHF